MNKINKQTLLAAVIFGLFLGGQGATRAQTIESQREPSTNDGSVIRAPSAKGRILLNIARAVIEVLCAEYGNCTSTSNTTNTPSTGTTVPSTRDNRRYLTPDFAGSSASPSAPKPFSFVTPGGWQSYEDQSSVTIAPPSEYVSGDLANGVILGLFNLNNASFETGTETYVRGLVLNNKYLKRIGGPQGNTVDNVPCMINRLEGVSPRTHYVESVVVYTCRRNAQALFYAVTVNSGPYANRYEEENSRITQSISFR